MGCGSSGVPQHVDRPPTLRKRCEDRLSSVLAAQESARSEKYRFKGHKGTSVFPSMSEVLPGNYMTGCDVDDKEPTQTILFFDWDDTLYPRTWANKREYRNTSEICHQDSEDLRVLSLQVLELLTAAQNLGKVTIVTNAGNGWVDVCCNALMPEAAALLRKVPVVYAMESLSIEESAGPQTRALLTEAKARAMRTAISDFYSCQEGKNWKNIVSIGDGRYERDAVRQLTQQAASPCRTKTIKMVERPCLESVTLQLAVLADWLPSIVHWDNDINIDFGEKR